MTEQQQEKELNNEAEEGATTEESPRRCKHHRCGKRHGLCRIVVGVFAVIGVIAIACFAFGSHGCHHGWHHGVAQLSGAELTQRIERMSDRALDYVDATDAQREQIASIMQAYKPQFEQAASRHIENRQQALALLGKAEVDRAALEQLRLKAFGSLEANSSELVQMAADIADVLTVEQRQKLIAFQHHHS